ncbi:barstar family protein [Deinococcus wulumuqiensis]|uniref:Nuclease inhibitor n=1 Tax=Deinococcus wulumuqiensis TaxID=980427 RepID=A0A345IDR0_9DEIO|nr:barstar family protein [Deinococcus wulumuqiensis]AXG97832.1 nuclease inhibitor [Deinococcus wulumuqiensis]QII20944.1 barstar family protein [Deinococcus wulumuqiensis R12]GGI79355.1 nuclease inhibitor [Deinococcus wulumuqiensis]GGP28942.1 nuclease inhibitor [Deinococcus wulumuqiensis]
MINVFAAEPEGLQQAPHEIRMLAAGHQVSVREVSLAGVRDKDGLMLAFLSGLGLTQTFGRNWDALYDVLTDPEQVSGRFALVLRDYDSLRRHRHLCAELEGVLLDAQQAAREQGRRLWLLAEEPDSDTRHW